MNGTAAFQALVRAYLDYHPVRELTEHAPADPRIDGTRRLWFEQRWGRRATYLELDDRSYRDVRLRNMIGRDDTGERADNPARTMLGKAQLAWAEERLRAAQREGITWKIVAISSPIDEAGGDLGTGKDGGKSWAGGYRAERDELLRFLDREGIRNVVFLTTDDHLIRVNALWYREDGAAPGTHGTRRAGNAITIVAGPMGAGGPDVVLNHDFEGGPDCPSTAALFALALPAMGEHALADCIAAHEREQGLHPLGLPAETPGLANVWREGHQRAAGEAPGPVDFFSRDTFNWCEIDIDGASGLLHAELRGIRSYPASAFPEADEANPVHTILSFDLAPEAAPISGSPSTVPGR